MSTSVRPVDETCRICMLYATKGNHTEFLREYLDAIPEEDWTPSRRYARRLAICKRRCPDYRNGCCLHCADFVEIRAARREAKCPAPKSRWQAVK